MSPTGSIACTIPVHPNMTTFGKSGKLLKGGTTCCGTVSPPGVSLLRENIFVQSKPALAGEGQDRPYIHPFRRHHRQTRPGAAQVQWLCRGQFMHARLPSCVTTHCRQRWRGSPPIFGVAPVVRPWLAYSFPVLSGELPLYLPGIGTLDDPA